MADGDTVDIVDDVRGRLRIRLLGIDTPETKKPGYTVGCWGPQATEFAKSTLHNIEGVDIGDIDVLALHEPSRTLYIIEAKSFITARTPSELQNELSDLLEGPHSAVERLRGRYEWAVANSDAVFSALGIDSMNTSIQPLIVIDADLLTAQFATIYDIVTLRGLRDYVDQPPHISSVS